MVKGPGQAKGCAVEVAAPDVKGEQELAGEEQLTAPAGEGPATDGQNILQSHISSFKSRNVCFNSETSILQWKPELRNAWGQ